MPRDVIRRWECPKCEVGSFRRFSSHSSCPGVPVERVYVAVDALLNDGASRAASQQLTTRLGCVCSWDEHGNPPDDCACAERSQAAAENEGRRVMSAAIAAVTGGAA